MTATQLIRKYFDRTEADYLLYNFECNLCHREFEPDTSEVDLIMHLKIDHPTVKEFK